MIRRIKRFKDKHPFLFIMAIALVLRLVAVFFSKGFGMHDDHFLVIEPAASWADGTDYMKWLPGSPGNNGPEGHSFFYVGFHFLVMKLLQLFGIQNPQYVMFFIRLIHAFLSLLVVSFGYRIASLITERKTAYKVALLLAVFWFIPFLSVRNLVEMVSIPFLMYGTLIILRQELIRKANDPGYHQTSFLVAGFFLGMAFSVRYQSIIYTGGLGLALLVMRNWKGMLTTTVGFLASVIIFQGIIDFFIWHSPFAELIEYIRYNLGHAYEYQTLPWYHYILEIFGLLIPPISLMLLFGFFKEWKRHFLLFLPVLLFLVFHSIFPNKQERFILPVIPMFIVLGLAGWESFVDQTSFWKKNPKVLSALWAFFWLINITLLLFITPMFSKKARVESMTYLSRYDHLQYLIIEDISSNIVRFPPVFYTGQWPHYDAVTNETPYSEVAKWKDWSILENQPDFVLFYQPDQLEARVDSMKRFVPGLVFETRIDPSFMDQVIHRLNPVNANESITIYRNSAKQQSQK